jgi:hypothetical protein
LSNGCGWKLAQPAISIEATTKFQGKRESLPPYPTHLDERRSAQSTVTDLEAAEFDR